MKKTIQLLSTLCFVMVLSAGVSYAQCAKTCASKSKAQASTSEMQVQKVAQQSATPAPAAKKATSCCPHAAKAASANCNPAACTSAKAKTKMATAPVRANAVPRTRTAAVKTSAVSNANEQ